MVQRKHGKESGQRLDGKVSLFQECDGTCILALITERGLPFPIAKRLALCQAKRLALRLNWLQRCAHSIFSSFFSSYFLGYFFVLFSIVQIFEIFKIYLYIYNIYIYIFLFLFSRNFKFSEIYKLINLSFFEKLQKIKKKDKLFFKYKIQQGKENLGKESKTTQNNERKTEL